jgi:biopolymer transport protein ExbB/TolQ
METLFQQIALVGDIWVLWLLVALSLLGGAVFFERLRLLRREAHLAQQTATLLHGPQGRGTLADSPAPLAEGAVTRVVADLERQNTGHTDLLEQVLQAALLFERRDLERRLAVLGTIGSNAPFIGLLGTVLGVIQAFHDLALAGDGGTGVVMSGIASALVITAAGLVVAIPAVIANNYFRTMIEDILSCAEAAGRLRLAAIAARPATAEIAGGIPR